MISRQMAARGFLVATLAACVGGCTSSSEKKAPQLQAAAQLHANAGETIRVVGTARYTKAAGPSVAGADYEIRVFPRTAWGPELDGKSVEVTGKLNDSHATTPPDPSINPGEYWLSDVTWTPATTETKR